MKHEIDIFSEIVDSIRDRYDILSYSHVNDTYVFATNNLGDMLVGDYIEILGIDCLVTAVDSNLLQFTIVSESNLEAAQWWKAKKPYFDYEKVLGESNTLLEKTNSAIYRLQKYPLIFLPLDIEQERDVDSAIQIQLKNVIFYILTSTENNNQYAKWRLTNIFKTILIPIYEKFFEAIKISPYIYDKNNLINHLYIENYLQSDNNNNIFIKYTDAIQLRFSNISLINLSSSCDKFAIAPLPYIVFSYSNFSAVYADDADYNDVISCSLTATNNLTIPQTCIIYFKLGDYLVQQTYTIPSSSSHTFIYNFENVNIFQENIVTVFNSANQLIDTVIIPAIIVTPFEMFFTSGTLSFGLSRVENPFFVYLTLDDGSIRAVEINNYDSFVTITQVYSNSNQKRIWIEDIREVSHFYVNNQYNLSITNQIWKFRNITYLHLVDCKLNLFLHEIRKLKKLKYLFITQYTIITGVSCYIDNTDLLSIKNILSYLYLLNLPNVSFPANTIEQLTNLTYIRLYFLGLCYISEFEIEKLTKLESIYLTFQPYRRNCYINNILNRIKLSTLNLYQINIVIPENTISSLSGLKNTSYLDLRFCTLISISSTEIFRTSTIYLMDSNMTSQSVDNVFIRYAALIQAGSLIPAGQKVINVSGTTNGKVTTASLPARNYLVAQGYTLTYNS
jgi:hypothetical protein